MLGKERPIISAPWFYSDQFDVKLQMVGLSEGSDQTVIRGRLADHKFSAFYFRAGRLIAVDTVNQPAEHVAMRKLFDRQNLPTPQQALDPGFELKSLLA